MGGSAVDREHRYEFEPCGPSEWLGRRAQLHRSTAARGPAVEKHGVTPLERVARPCPACRKRTGDDLLERAVRRRVL
jgi:hypothetical protein